MSSHTPEYLYALAESLKEARDSVWKRYANDFNAMTDEEVEYERRRAQDLVDEQEEWLEAVAAWEAAGKPRGEQA